MNTFFRYQTYLFVSLVFCVSALSCGGGGGDDDGDDETLREPTGLIATPISANQIDLSWESGGGSTDGFIVSYQIGSTAPADCASGTIIEASEISGTTISIPGLMANVEYAFRVCAINGDEVSEGITVLIATAPQPFVALWRTTSPSEQIMLPLRSGFLYNMTVDWGDGTPASPVTSAVDPRRMHTYLEPGDYTVTITGLAEAWYFNNGGSKDHLISISNLGDMGWVNLENAFYGCQNLTTVAGGNTLNTTNMSGMFWDAPLAEPDTDGWDTSKVTDMSSMFQGAAIATPDTSNWDTSNVTDMSSMFAQASAATPDTANWNTAKVTSMRSMFHDATNANPATGGWDTSLVQDMTSMFHNATSAVPDTSGSGWSVANVTLMASMFDGATNANPATGGWDTSLVEDMSFMFRGATSATPDTSGWMTMSLTNVSAMFEGATAANPDVSGWDTSNVTDMSSVFHDATVANPDIDGWSFTSATTLTDIIAGSGISVQNYSDLLLGLDANWMVHPQTLTSPVTYIAGGDVEAARTSLLADPKNWTINDVPP